MWILSKGIFSSIFVEDTSIMVRKITMWLLWKGIFYIRNWNLTEHISFLSELCKKTQMWLVTCNTCRLTHSGSGSLKIHINTVHNGKKGYKFDPCGKLLIAVINFRFKFDFKIQLLFGIQLFEPPPSHLLPEKYCHTSIYNVPIV